MSEKKYPTLTELGITPIPGTLDIESINGFHVNTTLLPYIREVRDRMGAIFYEYSGPRSVLKNPWFSNIIGFDTEEIACCIDDFGQIRHEYVGDLTQLDGRLERCRSSETSEAEMVRKRQQEIEERIGRKLDEEVNSDDSTIRLKNTRQNIKDDINFDESKTGEADIMVDTDAPFGRRENFESEDDAPKKRGRKKKDEEAVAAEELANAEEQQTSEISENEEEIDTAYNEAAAADEIANEEESVPDDGNVYLKGHNDYVDNPNSIDIMQWEPKEDEIFFTEKDGMIEASYLVKYFNVPEDRWMLYFIIAKKHYKERIPDLLQHINYFISHYDPDHEYLMALLSVKYFIDHNPGMTKKAFQKMLMARLVTQSMINKVKQMALDLYKLNINTDRDGKYKTTPKISNDHARMIVAVSFCIRLLLPICIHFSNTNATFINKRDYIDCFDRIFMQVVDRFEKNDIRFWNPMCRFVAYRIKRSHTTDAVIWEKKKQLYGTTMDLYLESIIHEVILVKSLHKLTYNRSIVSFIDGIITHSYTHYRYENFKFKPVEIESEDNDSDDYLSHQETLEMQISRIDESNQLINEVNTEYVMNEIRQRFNVNVTQEEIDFYFKNMKLNSLTQTLLHAFFSKYFHDTNAIRLLEKRYAVELAIYMKKYFQLRGMQLFPQICTAQVMGKFKDTCIKNVKFLEKFRESSIYTGILKTKYRYIAELRLKEDPIIKLLSTMLNSTFVLVDTNPDINGRVADNFNPDILSSEFMLFLSIC